MLKGKYPKLGLRSVNSLCRRLELDAKVLADLCENADSLYREWDEPKRNAPGKTRHIESPCQGLKSVQRRINSRLLSPLLQEMVIAYGGIKKRSNISAAALHTGQDCVVCIDIKNFFPSVTNKHVYGLFTAMQCIPDVAHYLTRLTTRNGHLPQGTPTSTSLANLLLSEFDMSLHEFCINRGLKVCRFVDDIIISGQRESVYAAIQYCIPMMNRLGMQISYKKLKIRTTGYRKQVLGLLVESRLSIPKPYMKQVRSQIGFQRRMDIPDLGGQRRIAGQLRYVGSVDPTKANALLKYSNC